MAAQYPGWRTMTGAQRRNARQDRIWQTAMQLRQPPPPEGLLHGECPACGADIPAAEMALPCADCGAPAPQES